MNAGRKRTFDKDAALDKAMKVFWANGYSGSSLSELTEAMGINKPSMYSAFGNKEALFINAIEYYFETHASKPNEALFAENQSLHERLRTMLRSIASLVCNPKLPGGCFFVLSLNESASDCLPPNIVNTVNKIYDSSREQTLAFFKNEQTIGNISDKNSAKVLCGHLMTLQLGIASLGRSGVNKKEIHDIIDHALLSFI